jgi:hypothetical protein
VKDVGRVEELAIQSAVTRLQASSTGSNQLVVEAGTVTSHASHARVMTSLSLAHLRADLQISTSGTKQSWLDVEVVHCQRLPR